MANSISINSLDSTLRDTALRCLQPDFRRRTCAHYREGDESSRRDCKGDGLEKVEVITDCRCPAQGRFLAD